MTLIEQFGEFGAFFIVYICLITFIIGLVMGSFLNCTAIRIIKGESISRGRSHCMSCNHVLGPADLIPLFSWIALKGRCRYCGEHISARYPLSELATGICFVSVVLLYGLTNQCLEMLILWSFLMAIAFSDIEDYLIPDRFIIAGIILRVVYIFVAAFFPEAGAGDSSPSEVLLHLGFQSLIGGITVSIPLLMVVLIMERIFHRDFMGGGDVKLLFMIGIYFTWGVNWFSIFVACIAGIIGGTYLKKQGILEIPFGPFIIGGAWVGMICGQQVIDFYFSLF